MATLMEDAKRPPRKEKTKNHENVQGGRIGKAKGETVSVGEWSSKSGASESSW